MRRYSGRTARRMAVETRSQGEGAAIRACRPEDAGAVTSILQDSAEAADWSPQSYKESLSWTGVVALVSEREGKTTGFIIGRQVGGEAEILNLAVTPARRRKGEGGALLGAVFEEFAARRVTRVFLEVRESNEMGIAFYSKHGFAKAGRRPGYYREPDEAAIVMEKKLTG
jgi:ribosomal-protein-alanine N-acetyltransferase